MSQLSVWTRTSDTGLAHRRPQRAGTNPVEWGAAWLQDELESVRGRAALEPLSVCNFFPAHTSRFEKVNRSVYFKVRLLASSSVERFAADFCCFYNYLSDEEYIPSSEAPQIYRSSLGATEGEGEGKRERERESTGTRTLALPAGITGLKYEEADQQPMLSKNRLTHPMAFLSQQAFGSVRFLCGPEHKRTQATCHLELGVISYVDLRTNKF